jgi:hypothetical protein
MARNERTAGERVRMLGERRVQMQRGWLMKSCGLADQEFFGELRRGGRRDRDLHWVRCSGSIPGTEGRKGRGTQQCQRGRRETILKLFPPAR